MTGAWIDRERTITLTNRQLNVITAAAREEERRLKAKADRSNASSQTRVSARDDAKEILDVLSEISRQRRGQTEQETSV